uniref:Uncharacterized protein n=1 Tax=Arundo donax TaxID=35708 RepID=A0A0A9B5A2_ARUDO
MFESIRSIRSISSFTNFIPPKESKISKFTSNLPNSMFLGTKWELNFCSTTSSQSKYSSGLDYSDQQKEVCKISA